MHPIRFRHLAGALLFSAFATATANAQINLGGVDTNRFERAAEINRGKVDLEQVHKTGVAAYQAGDYAAADEAFSVLVEKDPKNADANFLLGLAKYGQEDWEGARTYFEAATKRDKQHADARTQLGLTLIRLGDLNSAIDVYRDLEALNERCNGRCKNEEQIKQGVLALGGSLKTALEQTPAE